MAIRVLPSTHVSELFAKCCELAAIPTTRRQLNKFNRHKGLANSKRREAIRTLVPEVDTMISKDEIVEAMKRHGLVK